MYDFPIGDFGASEVWWASTCVQDAGRVAIDGASLWWNGDTLGAKPTPLHPATASVSRLDYVTGESRPGSEEHCCVSSAWLRVAAAFFDAVRIETAWHEQEQVVTRRAPATVQVASFRGGVLDLRSQIDDDLAICRVAGLTFNDLGCHPAMEAQP